MRQGIACHNRNRMSAGDAGRGFNFLVTFQMFGKNKRPQPAHGIRVSHVDRVEVDPRASGDSEIFRQGREGDCSSDLC